ncbi:hypothetical protein BLNAU_22795 [Blattamonas nauphoetae]|uniref:Uncharacterized protein n=1 Tax=Blattamonas nauphoetae TaxID=2049346 RepID=A0ABQ9WS35_9EUKA|nr:hypothetical protein BLNAU_22795 [Blattamonas nauphoetae]
MTTYQMTTPIFLSLDLHPYPAHYSSRLPPRPPNTIRRPQRTILSPNSSHGDSPTTLHHPSKRLPSHVLDQSEQKEEAEKKIAKQAERPTTKAAISTKQNKASNLNREHESSNKSPHPPSIPHTFRREGENSKREEANVHAGQVSENKEDTKEDNGNDIIRKIKRRHPNSTGTDSTPKNDEKISIDLPSPPAISGPQNEGMISERTLKVSIKAQMRVRERGIAKLRERHLTRLGQPQTSRRGLQKSKRTTKKELPPDFFNLMSKRIKDLTDAQWDTLRRHSVSGADTTMLEIHNPANSSSPPIDINFGTDTVISPFPRLQPAGADTTMLEIHNPANSSSPPIDINFGIDTAISPFPRLQPAGADTTMLEMHNPANSSSPPIDINFGIDTAISPSRDYNQPELTQRCSRYTTQPTHHHHQHSPLRSRDRDRYSLPTRLQCQFQNKTGMASMHLPIKRNSSLLSSAEARDTRNTARQELVGEQSINDRDRERLAVAKGNQLGLTEKCRLLVRRMNQFDCIHLNTIRNDLTLGTDELRPRRAERWSAQKMNQFNILTTTPIEMLFPVVGLGTTLPLDNQTLKSQSFNYCDEKFSVVNAWKSLAGPEAIGLKRDNPSNLARQKRAEYSEARERFDITNTFNMPAKHHHPISFQRANTPPLEEIQTLISLPFDPFDGYTRWDADLSTRHLRKAKDALKQTFSDLLTTLSAPNPDLMSANVIAGKISAIPQTLKGGQKSEYHPPRAETMIHGKTLSKERRNRIETLVGKGKSSSALKELTQLENQTEPPLETILQQIQALHNFEDEKTLQLSPSHHTNKPDKGGEATEIKNALNSLNTNSAPSLDGLTVELIKRCCISEPHVDEQNHKHALSV